MAKTCFELKIGFPINLVQHGPDNFTVVYGRQIRNHLTYSDAATELGCCIMHALACENRIDNPEK